ncbi:sigma-70 family RNA polymerase sigma factor [Actinopolymorpha alba]|uniref:sigma-70 family RNA polymerase sigma factor n=1 Tax=Actinopolymorpha alba TaxID=533267 RepID=UPI0003751A44|nr:sigma-70 family RNA polymerase sigma factor [Actinopolymorpha alba]
MDDSEWLAGRFEEHRPHLRAVAYRMLGSPTEAEDAVQDAWLRVSRSGAEEIENLKAWLTTIVARVCLNLLRSRNTRRDESLEARVPELIVAPAGGPDPEEEVQLADSVGLALQIVLDTLTPAERLAFVLHDMFDLRFEEIAPLVGRTPQATRQLASRARRRIKGAELPALERDLARQRAVVDAFLAAARAGDFHALIAVLHPDVVARADFGPRHPSGPAVIRGAETVARQARFGATPDAVVHPVLVNGAAGVVITRGGQPYAVMAFTIVDDKIVQIDTIADRDRVTELAAPILTLP